MEINYNRKTAEETMVLLLFKKTLAFFAANFDEFPPNKFVSYLLFPF